MGLENKQSKKKKVTVNDIAKAVGMSASTVSRALLNHPKISSSSTKDVVHKTAKKLRCFAGNSGYMVLGQIKMDVKSNEITVIPKLLDVLEIEKRLPALMSWEFKRILQIK